MQIKVGAQLQVLLYTSIDAINSSFCRGITGGGFGGGGEG